MKAIPILLSASLLMAGTINAQKINNSTKKKEITMSASQNNEQLIRQLYEQVLNKRDTESVKELISDDFVGVHGVKGPAGFVKPITGLVAAFPDIQWRIEDLFGQRDQVAIRWTWSGTSTAPFNGYPPTGKTVINEGMAIYHIKEGKVIGAQLQTDRLSFWQQMNVVPADLGKPAAPPKEQMSK